MTIYQQTLKTLEAQFKTATDAVVAQFRAATEAVLLAQEAAYNVQNDELGIYKGDKAEKLDNKPAPVACGTVAAPTSPPPFYAPGIDTSIPVPCTAVPLRAPAQTTKSTKPPPRFVAPPAQDIHAESVTIGTGGVVHVSWAAGAAPVVPLTAVPMLTTQRPPPPPAPGLPVGASAAPWTPPPPIAWEWPTLPPKGTPAPVFVPGQPPVTVEKEDDEVEDVLQPSDVNDAWYPEAGQTWDDEPEPVDPRGDVSLPDPPAPVVPQPAPSASAKLGDPSRDPNRRAERFTRPMPKGTTIVPPLGKGEPRLRAQREVELREGTPSALRTLLSLVYKAKNYADLVGLATETMVGFALDHEAAKGWITPEFASVRA